MFLELHFPLDQNIVLLFGIKHSPDRLLHKNFYYETSLVVYQKKSGLPSSKNVIFKYG